MSKSRSTPLSPRPRDWGARAKGLLKAELVKRGIGYQQLSERLQVLGVTYTQENLANKINRGKFSVAFLLQCLEAIECKVLRINDD